MASGRHVRRQSDRIWQWQLHLKASRLIAWTRLAAVVLTFAVWVGLPPLAGGHPRVEQVLVPVAVLYGVAAALVVYRWPSVARRFPHGSLLLDALFVAAWVWASGGGRGPFLPLLFVLAANGPLRLSPVPGMVLAVGSAVACRVLGGPAALPVAGYMLLAAVTSAFWSAQMLGERQSAMRDALTGAVSRAQGLFLLRDMLKSDALPLCVALLDLDGFKDVNDGCGHLAGDAVLVRVVRTAYGNQRPQDVLARYGGDEFLIVWPRTSAGEAADLAERLREAIERQAVQVLPDGPLLRITVSAGIAVADRGMNPLRLVHAADRALYAAKRARNRVVVSRAEQT